jgi:hypothetical protein
MKGFLLLLVCCILNSKEEVPHGAQKLIKAYPEKISHYKDNKIFFKDGSSLVYDDGKPKNTKELLENPDIEDQFKWKYENPGTNDAGRIRNEAFFKKIYGNSKEEVAKKLVEITWCPKLVNQKIKVTTVNGIDKKIQKIGAELEQYPELKPYITNIAGTFNWRKIAGTNRLSTHSFGMTMDINTKFSNYWQWDCKCTNEETKLKYKNRIPKKIIAIFEKHGFIWGGNWLHYDTMHFEYRPEFF